MKEWLAIVFFKSILDISLRIEQIDFFFATNNQETRNVPD